MLYCDDCRHDDRHAPPVGMIKNVPITFLDFPSTQSTINRNMLCRWRTTLTHRTHTTDFQTFAMTQLSQAKYPSVKEYTMKARPTQLFCNISLGVWICSRPRKKRNVVRLINVKIVTLSCAMKDFSERCSFYLNKLLEYLAAPEVAGTRTTLTAKMPPKWRSKSPSWWMLAMQDSFQLRFRENKQLRLQMCLRAPHHTRWLDKTCWKVRSIRSKNLNLSTNDYS